ncbi:hypothetical protein C8R45DRAFT_1106253 [Mycena sanguinolenta]|nr:hypothetical protein C8R45DRAFT_1106253 [Mycena sanguinolenta]
MFFSQLLAIVAAASIVAHALPQSPVKRSFSAFSPARDDLAARCAVSGECAGETRHIVDRFFDIAKDAIAARVCDGCCGDNCTCLRSEDIRCIGTEEDFVNRAYEEATRNA